jgi:MSHA pilin protein MshA
MDEKGFTLIELIVIIVILGILAVTAVPKYIDMQKDAKKAVADGIAGALTGAAATNYGAYLLKTANPSSTTTFDTLDATAVCTAALLGPLLADPTQLTGYNLAAGTAIVGASAGNCSDTAVDGSDPAVATKVARCTVTYGTDTDTTSSFNVMCTR